MVKSGYMGDKLIPPLIGILISWVYRGPYGLGLSLPSPMEIMGVDRPDRTFVYKPLRLAGLLDFRDLQYPKPLQFKVFGVLSDNPPLRQESSIREANYDTGNKMKQENPLLFATF